MFKKKSLGNNMFFNIIYTVSNILCQFITFPYVARVLLPQKIGMLNYVESIIAYYTMLASLGIQLYATRECAKMRDDKIALSKFAQEIFLFNLAASALAYVLLIPVLFSVRFINYRNLIVIYSVMIGFTSLGMEWLYAALEEFKYIAVRTLAIRVFIILLTFVLVKEEEDYLIYAILQVVSNVGNNFFNLIYSKRLIYWRKPGKYQFNKHLKPIMYFFVLDISTNVFNIQDRTMLGAMAGDVVIGYYALAYKIMNIVVVSINSLGPVIMSRLSFYMGSSQKKEFEKLADRSINMILFFSIPAFAGINVLAENIIYIIGGEQYKPAVLLLKLLSVFIVVATFNAMVNLRILVPLGEEKSVLKIDIFALIENTFLNLLLIPRYQASGAAIATLITEISISVFCLKHYKISYSSLAKSITKNLLCSLCMVMAIFLLKYVVKNDLLMCILGVIVGVFVYFGIQLKLKNETACLLWELYVKKIVGSCNLKF